MPEAKMSCRKCGCEDIGTAWHRDTWECGFSSRDRGFTVEGEHLHDFCRGCRYEWTRPPLNAEGEICQKKK